MNTAEVYGILTVTTSMDYVGFNQYNESFNEQKQVLIHKNSSCTKEEAETVMELIREANGSFNRSILGVWEVRITM